MTVLFLKRNIEAMLVGFLLDLLLGDPEGWLHPVIWIGRFISFMENRLRKRGGDLRKAAPLLTASTVLLSMTLCAAVLWIPSLFGKIPLFIGMCVISWQTLSCKCLAKEGNGTDIETELFWRYPVGVPERKQKPRRSAKQSC